MMAEPGNLRTDFLDASSLGVSPAIIEEYAATAGKVRSVATGLSHARPGVPTKLAKVLVDLADATSPPLRLPLGSDSVAAIGAKPYLEREHPGRM